MRYPDGGGLTAQRRLRREQVRMRAADRFAEGASDAQMVADLAIRTVYQLIVLVKNRLNHMQCRPDHHLADKTGLDFRPP